MRRPCQVTTDVARPIGEPGDTERQRADNNQKENDADHCAAGLLKRRERVGGNLSACGDCRVARLRLLDPVGGGGLCRIRQCGDVVEGRGDIVTRGVERDAGDDRRRIVANRRIDRRDAHKPLRAVLDPSEKARFAGRRVGRALQCRGKRRELMRQRSGARHAVRGVRRKWRGRVLVDAECLHRCEFGLVGRAAFDRRAQRLGGNGQPRRLIVGSRRRMRGIVGQRLHRAFQRRDTVCQAVDVALRRVLRRIGRGLSGVRRFGCALACCGDVVDPVGQRRN